MKAWVILGLALVCLGATALPPKAEELRGAMLVAERSLQDSSLEFQAAKHAAEPLQNQVTEARQKSGTWWGSWLLKRQLGRLKNCLDRVERARVNLVEARQGLSLLLTGAEEELSAALEVSIVENKTRFGAETGVKWRTWWEQKRAWQQRLDALHPDSAGELSNTQISQEAQRIQKEARQAQWDRDRGLLQALRDHQVIGAGEFLAEQRRLKNRAGLTLTQEK